MKRSSQRILTTHTGSLPRPRDLEALLTARDAGAAVDRAHFAARARDAVLEVARAQVEAGIDVVSDGEMSKPSYATYAKDRLTGFEGEQSAPLAAADLADYPEYAERLFGGTAITTLRRPACVGPITYRGQGALRDDLEALRAATLASRPTEAFMTAASPGTIALFLDDRHYGDHEKYVFAIADAMREEYETIAGAGFVLQLDAPDLAMARARVELHVAAIDRATRNIAPDQMRLHVCWGNYEGPHHRDTPLGELLAPLFRARPAGLSFVAANPRHEHEWRVFDSIALPTDKLLIPGVIDSTTNFVEHPELVAERIARFASRVGRDRVIAGTDCGFATIAGYAKVDPKIAWAKLRALAEGAHLASTRT